MTQYNWTSTGPGGCDAHCIEHPCGKCILGVSQVDALKAENEVLRRLAKEGTRLHCCGMCKHCQEVSEVLSRTRA